MDCINVLRGGWPQEGEFENGAWRYRVRTPRICVVVQLDLPWLLIVTAWRITK
jgi:hypothetical protein